jgi:CRP-like cAMP-binding protein
VVRGGTIHLVRYHEDGSALILQRARAGSILAEASVYSARYHCDARAETSATTWAVSRHDLRTALAESPEFSEAWASHLAHEVQRARLQAEILSLKTVASRLSAWIAWSGALPEKGQWSLLAQEIGVSPEALYREIANRRRLR